MNKSKIIIYQVFTRLFGNSQMPTTPNGTIKENGCGKMADFTIRALNEIKKLGASYIWYTGIIEHATQTNYTRYYIRPDHPAVVKGKAGSPYAIKDYYDDSRFSIRSDVTMYNPVSIGKFFKRRMPFLDNFWIETGSQSLQRVFHTDFKTNEVRSQEDFH